jgi:class 3 adenylate cyclase
MLQEPIHLTDAERNEIEQFRSSHETKVLTIFFSDLVGSTKLQVEQGNQVAAKLVHRHYSVMRNSLDNFEGKEISTAGDSMLIVFLGPADAVKFALCVQKAMAKEREQEPLLPSMRCGVHHGQVVLHREGGPSEFTDIYGVQVSTAARIMSLGEADQILMSRAVFDDARTILAHEQLPEIGELKWVSHGTYRFKGIPDELEVCEVGEVATACLRAPGDSLKAWVVKPNHPLNSHPPFVTKVASMAIASALLLMACIGIVVYQSRNGTPSENPDKLDRPSPQAKQELTNIESQLFKLEGVQKELEAVESLEPLYQKATNAIFGGEPAQVKSECVAILSRLRTYDLTEDEQELVKKADKMLSATISIFPEELYNIVRQLATKLNARRNALLREKESLEPE